MTFDFFSNLCSVLGLVISVIGLIVSIMTINKVVKIQNHYKQSIKGNDNVQIIRDHREDFDLQNRESKQV